MRAYVVVPVYNRIRITASWLEQIANQDYHELFVVLVDDNSSDGTRAMAKRYIGECVNGVILNSGGNSWWGGSVQVGLEFVFRHSRDEGDVVIFMNDDTLFSESIISSLVSTHKDHSDSVIAAVNVVNGAVTSAGQIMKSWFFSWTFRPFVGCRLNDAASQKTYVDVDFVGARATLYPLTMLRTIGGVRWDRLPHYHADGELSYRAKRYGYRVLVDLRSEIEPMPTETGMYNGSSGGYRLNELRDSFFKFKSINCIKHRWNFACLAAPVGCRVGHCLFSVLKRFVISLRQTRF